MNAVVIGATGDVGRGIVASLLARGHRVIGVARDRAKLDSIGGAFDNPLLTTVAGSLADDRSAETAANAVRGAMPEINSVVVSINGPRKLPGLLSLPSEEFARLIAMDMTTHFTAARAFLPLVTQGGVYLGIGGGSADFILAGGAHMSVAQAGLRMLYRGLIEEHGDRVATIRLLTIASVVNGANTRDHADPLWVTDREVGDQAAAMLERPGDFAAPVWRISRRDESGRPGFAADTPTRVQGLTS